MSGFKLFGVSSSPAKNSAGIQSHAQSGGSALGRAAVRRARWKMLWIMLVCAAPVLASYFTYYVLRPEGRRNFGELIEPQRPLPSVAALDMQGKTVFLPTLRGQWLLLSVAGGACDAACARHLYLQRQLRESLGASKDRVDWVWLVSDAAPLPDSLHSALSGATVLRLPLHQLAAWLTPAPGHALSEHLYLVDPLGHWMLRFPANLEVANAIEARRDLMQLLRASASWDQAGRWHDAVAR